MVRFPFPNYSGFYIDVETWGKAGAAEKAGSFHKPVFI
jgi:hypothetical protein